MIGDLDFSNSRRRRIPWPNAPMSDRGKNRLYYAAALCLIIAAAALRFYGITDVFLDGDELRSALWSRQDTIAEVLDSTRSGNASPILYPLVLYAVQKVESSPLSVRIVPAAASVLTVAALLILLPRVGVSRWAAFIAALLAAGSVEAIRHAQDVREYSVDALVAALMIVGLLSYLQEKRRRNGIYVLFCVSLFVAPLVQYGLVLFGIAVIGTIAVMEGKTIWIRRASVRDGLRFRGGWAWNRLVYLICPAASFAAGSVLSYAVTLRHQWNPASFGSDGYLAEHYYQGEYGDVRSLIEFASNNTWEMLKYHMPESIAMLGLAAFGIYVVISIRKRRLDTLAVLFMFSVAVAVCAAVLGLYPFGGVRSCTYIAPIVFLAFGHALSMIGKDVSRLARRAWTAHAGMGLAAGVIVFAGVSAIDDDNMRLHVEPVSRSLAILEERIQEGDAVYSPLFQSMEFYHRQRPNNYYYSKNYGRSCGGRRMNLRGCVEDILEAVNTPTDRLWILGNHLRIDMLEELHEEFHAGDPIENVFDGNISDLYLLEAPRLFDRLRKPSGSLKREGELIVRSNFDVYLREDRLVYVKEPCSSSDVEPRFFLHVTPVDADGLSDDRKQYGFENLDFAFPSNGAVLDGKCAAVIDIPQYDIRRISTGQYDQSGERWRGETVLLHLNGRRFRTEDVARLRENSAPVVRSNFDVHLVGSALVYLREPCDPSDTAASFFLHVTPTNIDDLPNERKKYGFANLDFDFSSFGIVDSGGCVAVRNLPEYDIEAVSTGQFGEEEGEIWRSAFPFTDD